MHTNMSDVAAIAKNSMIQVAGKVLSTVLGLIVIFLLGRAFTPAEFGQYTTVTTYLQFFGILVDFGLVLTTVQMISKRDVDENKIIANLFTLRLVSAVIFLGIAPLVALNLHYAPEVKLGIAITSLSFLCVALNQILTGLFQKHLSVIWVAISENAGRVALLIGTIVAITLGRGLIAVLIAVVLGSLVQFLVLLAASRKYVRVHFAWDMAVWREIIERSWPIGVSIAFNLIYLRADTLIVEAYFDDATVGYYGGAYRVIDILLMVPVMTMGVVLPALTAAWDSRNTQRFTMLMQKTFDVFVSFIVPIAVGGWFTATAVMTLIMGDAYAPAGPLLAVLLVGLAGAFVSTLFGHAVVAIDRQRKVLWIYAAVAAVTLLVYLVAIPRYGSIGGAWGTVLSEWLAAGLLAVHVTRATGLQLSMRGLMKVVFASVVMATVLWFLPASWPFLIVLGTGIVVYSGVLWVVRGFPV